MTKKLGALCFSQRTLFFVPLTRQGLHHLFLLCPSSDGLLSPRRESNQSAVKGTPRDTPDLRESHTFLALSNDRHAHEENIQRLPRSPATWRSLALSDFASGCLVRGCCSLLCTEVCFTLGQRQLFTDLVTDGLRAGRPSVVRWFYRRSFCRFGLGNLR